MIELVQCIYKEEIYFSTIKLLVSAKKDIRIKSLQKCKKHIYQELFDRAYSYIKEYY